MSELGREAERDGLQLVLDWRLVCSQEHMLKPVTVASTVGSGKRVHAVAGQLGVRVVQRDKIVELRLSP